MKIIKYIFSAILPFILSGCGSDPSGEALTAYHEKDYSTAIRLFKEARTVNKSDTLFQDQLALSYLYRGKDLYEKTRNLDAFTGNYKQAAEYIPEDRSQAFRKQYSQLLRDLAEAYRQTKPSTDLEKETYFDQSVNMVKLAIKEDSTNQDAIALLADIKQEHFEGLINKAKDLYNSAAQKGQLDLFFVSEYVFNQAAALESGNPVITDYLKRIKSNTLDVLNYRDGVALAVTGQRHSRSRLSLEVSIRNYLPTPLSMKLDHFKVVDMDGNDSFAIDRKAMKQNKLLGKTVLEDMVLDANNPIAEGNLVFEVPENVEIRYIAYRYNGNEESRKYFP